MATGGGDGAMAAGGGWFGAHAAKVSNGPSASACHWISSHGE